MPNFYVCVGEFHRYLFMVSFRLFCCGSSHCFLDCFQWAETQDKGECKHKSLSPPLTRHASSKARRKVSIGW